MAKSKQHRRQVEIFPELYPPVWECEHCGEDTSNVEYDYIGNGYNHLHCDLKEEEEPLVEVKHFADGFHEGNWEEDIVQEWPGLDAINKEWV